MTVPGLWCRLRLLRATAGQVYDSLRLALARHEVPEQILTDNGKVFCTAAAGRGRTTALRVPSGCSGSPVSDSSLVPFVGNLTYKPNLRLSDHDEATAISCSHCSIVSG